MADQFSQQELELQEEAIAFARKNKKKIGKRLTDTSRFVPEKEPVTVFMAGCPGAGKTEASIELIDSVKDGGGEILRVDPDELRSELPGYTGDNSWLFQGGVSILVEKVLDLALKQRQTFLLDGTLARYEVACRNIERCLAKGRLVQVLYVYQEPLQAWEFVQAREAREGRRILAEDFINQYFTVREVVNRLKVEYPAIKVDLLLKNRDGSDRFYKANVERIDNYIPEKYSRADLERMLGLD
ncbi:zeta toxin family protein [uncultured Alcanivorax sp.]|jgi:predicted ABC-type ATPase|uniref:zeta toxin family protein n=1 Tax=uncultured Alcanivorax sp. TaxID=191215 RepID=UPI00258F3C5F|nr:zeta toxin family protein [uncultured Alcanivorax sp.]